MATPKQKTKRKRSGLLRQKAHLKKKRRYGGNIFYTVYQQRDTHYIFLKDQTKIIQLERIITKMRYSLEGLNSRPEMEEEIIRKLEGRLIEII